jgi:hypothetical protein
MSYEVKIIADSIGPNKVRITTFQLKYPRLIHSEALTHRAFSRNASSSRAIPIEKMMEWVEADPVMPVHWGSKKRGMQAGEEIANKSLAELCWLGAFKAVLGFAKVMNGLGLHKQIVNRMLEPWSHINVVLTATTFDNFFSLRCHKDAQPEIQKLAVMMARAYRDSKPMVLPEGAWHLPYITTAEHHLYPTDLQLKMSTARCCRVSYLTMEGKPAEPEKDFFLHDQLMVDKHFSPFEHCAQATNDPNFRSGNFHGWVQYRQTLPEHCYEKFDYATLDQFDNDYVIG